MKSTGSPATTVAGAENAAVKGLSGFAAETKRICSIGSVTPDAWMREAVGGPLSTKPLVEDCAAAIAAIR